MGLLSYLLVTPLVGSVILLFLPKGSERAMRFVGLGTSLVVLALCGPIMLRFVSSAPGFQFLERVLWSRSLGISYSVGLDGLSLGLVVLTALLTPLAILVSHKSIQTRIRAFLILFLVLETGLIGVFVSLDLFLFYIFWELVLIPMYFIIGIWGHAQRLYATTKFVLYTLVGSLLMFVGILGIVAGHLREFGFLTFDLTQFYGIGLSSVWQTWIFFCLFLGFAIKIPLFPFHTWLPDAHVEAPTAGSVMLAGVLLKMGIFGFLRIALPVLPSASMAAIPWLVLLGLVGIVYGSLVALAQDDIKRLIAYSSIAHLGFCVVGIFSMTEEGVAGGVLQMVNHGISTGALFLLAGMLYERAHSYRISDFGGLAASMPRFTAVFGIIAFSSIGLPGLNNFVGEFLTLFGLFRVNQGAVWVALTGIVLAAWYMLRMFGRVFFGTPSTNRQWQDLTGREAIVITPLIILVFWFGIYPETVLGPIRPAAVHLIQTVESGLIPDTGGPLWAKGPGDRDDDPEVMP